MSEPVFANRSRLGGLFLSLLLIAAFATSSCGGASRPDPIGGPEGPVDDDVFEEAYFREPPPEFRPWIRWWWPGAAVDDARLAEELDLLASRGFGAVEIQPILLGLGDVEVSAEPALRSVGTAAFYAHLRAAFDAAAARGIDVDLTFGSGWPTAAPLVADVGERQLFVSEMELAGGVAYDGPVPPPDEPPFIDRVNETFEVVGPFDTNVSRLAVVAARRTNPGESPAVHDQVVDLTPFVTADDLQWTTPAGSWTVFSIYENRTRHHGTGAAFAGEAEEALVFDHLDPAGIAEYVTVFGDPLFTGLEARLPRALFVDSFELVGDLPWSPAFMARFMGEVDYDPTPYLPHIFLEGGDAKYTQILEPVVNLARVESSTGWRVREDYERIRELLFRENFIAPMRAYCDDEGVMLRMQAHGGWGDVLDDYAVADIPESEALYAGGSFDFLTLASSAAHVAGRRIASSESFIALGRRELDPEIIDRQIARAFGAGINRTVMHGYASRFILESGERWYPFPARGVEANTVGPLAISSDLREESVLWDSMVEANLRQSRLAYAMSRGERDVQIAWLHPERELRDRAAGFFGAEQGESAVSLALKRGGLTYDRISRAMLEGSVADASGIHVGEADYEGLLLTDLSSADPALLSAIQSAVDAGVPVVILGGFPDRAPGWSDHLARDAAVVAASSALEAGVEQAADALTIGAAFESHGLSSWFAPTASDEPGPAIVHRRLPGMRILLLANEHDAPSRLRYVWNLPAGLLRGLDVGDGLPLFERELAPGDELRVEVPARGAVVLYLLE